LRLDRNKLKQVFINLFMNAVHAMPDGGSLTIHAALHGVTPEDLTSFCSGPDLFKTGDQAVLVEIRDTGIGIPEDKVGQLFDPFFTTKPVGVGTGLGLSVTRKIIELHHAAIVIRNRTDAQGAEARMLFTI